MSEQEQVLCVGVCGGLVWHFTKPGESEDQVVASARALGIFSGDLEGVSFVEMSLGVLKAEDLHTGEVSDVKVWADKALAYWVSEDLHRFGWISEGAAAVQLHHN